MSKWIIGIIIVVSLILILQIWSIASNHTTRSLYYKLALSKAFAENKPLIVIGDPEKGQSCGLFGAPYGYGSVCIDIDPMDRRCLKSDATEYLRTIADDSAVIFLSCVLEYVDNIEELIDEIYRVAGDSSNIFIVHVMWYSLTAYLYRFQGDSAKNVITSAPPNGEKIEYFRI